MPFIDAAIEAKLKQKISSDEKELKSLYRVKSKNHFTKSVDHGLVEEYLSDGWEEDGAPLKTKTKIKKLKPYDILFEDQLWCQMYDLGYRTLNVDRNFRLPFGKKATETKQIDVIAINDESVLIIECKSKKKISKASSLKTEFEGLSPKIYGFSKALDQVLGEGRKVKYIYATRNLRIDNESSDAQRLLDTGSFLYNDNTFEYVNGLIKNYKGAAHYQFQAMLFRGKTISKTKIEVPAIEGKMGGKTYYMFSIEPHLLLKLGFVLHRTRANNTELPTYQRLLVPSRLKGIGDFINDNGYFPNSVILNFNTKNSKLDFQSQTRASSSRSRHGVLKIPNAYAIAYIIDGQHRIYGYAQSEFKKTNTIPAVAFVDLEPKEQLKIFMDINENQKAVSPTLRITLAEDLLWESPRVDQRMKALRSSIIRVMTSDTASPLFNQISIGEDKLRLSSLPFERILSRSGILPAAKGNKFTAENGNLSFYDTSDQDHTEEMPKARKRIVKFLSIAYQFMEEQLDENVYKEFILSNRGTFAFLGLVGSLNSHSIKNGKIQPTEAPDIRFAELEKYFIALSTKLKNLEDSDHDALTGKLGQGAETLWLRLFQSYVNAQFREYSPEELIDWKQRQDEELQNEGRKLGNEVEKYLKSSVINKLKELFGKNWELEIGSIQRQCESRAAEQREKIYKEKLKEKEIKWTEQFFITDYKTIIEKYWVETAPDDNPDFITFCDEFSIDVGHGFNSKKERTKWLSIFNSHRNSWAHEGSKEKGLNEEEVGFLRKVHASLHS